VTTIHVSHRPNSNDAFMSYALLTSGASTGEWWTKRTACRCHSAGLREE
jgi:hypothetical protein